MTLERGIVVGGRVVPGTDWVLRDSAAWWRHHERGTRQRVWPADILTGHWTAGPPREGPGSASSTVSNMKARRYPEGHPRAGELMTVGIHFVVGWDGMTWQTADLADATCHVSSSGINARSIGVETCWPGLESQMRKLGVDGHVVQQVIAGDECRVMEPSSALIDSWLRLAEALASMPPDTRIAIPRHVPLGRDGAPLLDRMSAKQARAWRGGLEHLHVPGTTKLDASGYLMGALCNAGWQGMIA